MAGIAGDVVPLKNATGRTRNKAPPTIVRIEGARRIQDRKNKILPGVLIVPGQFSSIVLAPAGIER